MNIFVYGTLRIDSVLLKTIGRVPAMVENTTQYGWEYGTAWYYNPYNLNETIGYIAAIPSAATNGIRGTILKGLDEREVHMLDEYECEGSMYDRIVINEGEIGEKLWMYVRRNTTQQ